MPMNISETIKMDEFIALTVWVLISNLYPKPQLSGHFWQFKPCKRIMAVLSEGQ
jgi:hypothetical protein